MRIQFKKLRVRDKDKILNFDGWFLQGEVSDYSIKVFEGNNCVTKLNPNIGGAFFKNILENVLNNSGDFRFIYHIVRKDMPIQESKDDNFQVDVKNIVEYEI